MGIDTIELIMEAEERFGVSLPDEEGSNVRTVGDFYEWILRHISDQSSDRCLTAMAFYRLRKGFASVMGADRRRVRPQQCLDEFLPPNRRRRAWPLVIEATGLRMPQLHRPDFLVSTLLLMSAGVVIGGLALDVLRTASMWVVWGLGAAFIALTIAVTRPLAVHLADGARNVGDLARIVSDLNAGRLATEAGGVNRTEVWRSVLRLVADTFGVEVRDLSAETRLVEDLSG